MKIQIVVTGRGYDAAETLPNELTLADDASLEQALLALEEYFPDDRPLPPTCLLAVSGRHLGTVSQFQSITLREGDELTLIAPVAGG